MRKYFLLLIIFIAFFYLSQNVNATYGAGFCVDKCSNCVASLWGLNTECTNVRCMVISCINGRSDCEREFKAEGTSCTGGSCCSGLCGSDPRTDTQCQNKVCGSSGWTAQNKADGTACTYSGKPSQCEAGKCKPLACTPCDSGATPCGSCSAKNPGKFCENVNGVGVLKDDPRHLQRLR